MEVSVPTAVVFLQPQDLPLPIRARSTTAGDKNLQFP